VLRFLGHLMIHHIGMIERAERLDIPGDERGVKRK